MSKKSFAQLFQRWVARGNRVAAPRASAKLRLEEVEQRVVPATTPPIAASASSVVTNTGGAFAPQVVADPTNPNTLAMVVVMPTGILAQISFDAGTSWTKLRDTNSLGANSVPATGGGDASGGKMYDPNLPVNNGSFHIDRFYTNASDATIAFTRSGSVYISYLEHNLTRTSGALLVERFDINRSAQSFTPYDLDLPRDWDNNPGTLASSRWEKANLSNNRAAVLYQWVDDGTNINRPANPYIAVDTNLPAFTDPATGLTTTDAFASFSTTTQIANGVDPATVQVSTASGADTVFIAWNTLTRAPVVQGGIPINAVPDLGYTPNAIMMVVGRLDTQALIDRPNPDAPVSAANQRQAAFLFSSPVPVNDGPVGATGGHFLGAGNAGLNTGGAAPVISFTPPSGNNASVTPGRMTITWGTTGSQIAQSSVTIGAAPAAASYTFRSNDVPAPTSGGGFFGGIGDASLPPPNVTAPDGARTTTFDIPVDLNPFTVAQGGSFTTLSDLDVTIAITANRLQDYSIELIAPDGTTITLVRNRLDGDGNTRVSAAGVTAGITGNDLGVAAGIVPSPRNQVFGNPVGTVFSQESGRQIHDPNNPTHYIGSYRPEAGSLAQFYGRNAAGLNSLVGSNWQLAITDFRNDRIDPAQADIPQRFVEFWSLTFTSVLDNSNTGGRVGADTYVTNNATAATVGSTAPARVGTVPFGGDHTFTAATASPTFGIGPGVSVAYDTTLGSFSPFSGRMYVAYTGGNILLDATGRPVLNAAGQTIPVTNAAGQGDTNVYLVSSDDGGASWNAPVQVNDDALTDNFSEGRRFQFQPTVTVDQTTGTVVVSWYDARNDASNTRVATYVTTSIDGGATFSPSRPVNTQKVAFDAITLNRVNLEPIPTNFAGLTTLNPGASQYGGAGNRQALVASGGVIRPFWTGNLNATGSSSIFTSTVRTAAGPRVVGSDMGAVTELSMDTDFLGNQLQVGTILVRDENNFDTTIRDAFGNARFEYNNTFAADGARLIDGFRVVFDRPIYFGTGTTQANAVADPTGEGFSAADVEVRFRGTATAIDTATQGARVPVRGVVPIGGFTDNNAYFATAFFVQFETPQSATGTYSYAVGPNVSDRVRVQQQSVFTASGTPLGVPDPGSVETSINIPPLAGNPTITQLRVGLSINHTFVSDLNVSLTGPNGVTIRLFEGEGGSQDNIVNMRLDDTAIESSPYTITVPFNNFNGFYRPLDPLSTFNGLPLSGVWTLRVEDTFPIDVGTITSFTLTFLDAAGNPFTVNILGNGLDQDADAIQREAANDTYSTPGSTVGTPFTGPYVQTTQPLVAAGAHVVHTYAGNQFAVQTAAVISNFFANALDVTLDREVDAGTLTLAGITSVTGPAGALTPTSVVPLNPLSGSTNTFRLFFGAALTSGAYQVVLNNRVYVTDDTVLNSTTNEVFVRFDRDINPASFTPANVLRITGPIGPVSAAGVTVTAVAEDRTALPGGTVAARLFRVTFDQPQLVVNLPVGFTSIPITLLSTPTAGPLTIANVIRLTGPNSAISLAGATLTGSGTSYSLNLPPANLPTDRPAGTYTLDLTPTPVLVQTVKLTPSTTLAITLTAPPTTGALTLADIVKVTAPGGTAINLFGATLSGSGTSYTLTFPTVIQAGLYQTELSPLVVRGVAVAGSGVRLSGGYTLEFGSNPAITDPVAAAIRAADRPQLVTTANGTGTTIPLTLSVAPTGGALTTADLVRVIGPNGEVLGGTVSGSGTTYTITFPAVLPAGQYVIDFTAAGRNIRVAGSGLPIDQNFNAGLDLLTGKAAAGAGTTPQTFTAPSAVPITPATTTGGRTDPSVNESTLTVTDDFVITQDAINRISVLLNISHPNDRDLTIELVPPSATGLTPILLYRGTDAVAFAPGRTANFRNTLLVDRVGDPNFPSILTAQPDYFPTTGGFSPQNALSRLADTANPVSARGVWTLRVTNAGTNAVPNGTSFPAGTPIRITNWSLTLPRAVIGSGLGERVADRFSAGFRVTTLDPTNTLSRDSWTAVGPSPTNEGANSGRVTAVVADPSDPSGNTVYVAAASGGVWKTTNFLTNDIDGPHYVPLTDFGPNSAVNIQSLAVFPRNGDPNQTIVFALTGEGNNVGTPQVGFTAFGVGVLRSVDGGRTWAVLDSTSNASTDPNVPPGTVGKVSDPGRDRTFSGASGFKIVVDPNPAPDGGVLVYMAVSGNQAQAGVWRSRDGGLTWVRVLAGQATDVVLAAGSANTTDPVTQLTISNGNLQRLYASFQFGQGGQAQAGVYFTDSAPSASGMTLMAGNQGLPSVRDLANNPPAGGHIVTVQNSPNPNGALGRIALAAPALTNDPLRNSFYKDWLYAVAVTNAGGINGLYQTKDAGKTWTQVQIPAYQNPAGFVFPTNDERRPDYDVSGGFGAFGTGNYNIAVSVDPQNPAVVYLSGLGNEGPFSPAGGSIRLDLTTIKDTQAFVNNNSSDAGGGFQANTIGGLTPRVNAANGGIGRLAVGGTFSVYGVDFVNASRDPLNPFITNATLRVANVASLVNDGSDIRWTPFNDVLQNSLVVNQLRPGKTTNDRDTGLTDIHAIFPFIDPITGLTRVIYGGDQGVFTAVDAGDGTLLTSVGFDRLITGTRNGDLQITQFYSGAVQPSQLAADVAGALFYGMAQDNGFTVSDPRLTGTGNTNWRGPAGDGAWVEVDQTGGGTAFQYRSPTNDGSFIDNNTTALPQDFFRVLPGNTDHEFSGGIGRTFGLIQNGDNPATDVGQWPAQGGFPFAVNPVNPNVLVIQSRAGRVFRSTDQGNNWIPIGQPNQLDATGPGALAFGAADPTQPALTNNFIYVGTAGAGNAGGNIYVTTTGGGTWTNISLGLDGSAVRRIVPNPAAGSKEVYAVTNFGVYYKADGTSAAAWTRITGSLFSLTRAAFGDDQDQVSALPQVGRAINALAVDWRFANPVTTPGGPVSTPDLYVGGVGGVFKSTDFGATWRLFPAIATEGATTDGGYLPSVEVTDLDLSIGNLNPTSGQYQAGGLNLLLASTYGRGSFAIRLSDTLPPQSFIKGPAVTAVINPNPAGGPSSILQVQFSGPVDPATLVPANFRLERIGAPDVVVPILSVTEVVGAGVQNRYEIAFPTQAGAPASYRLTVGFDATGNNIPSITDPSGFRMNQDGDTTNGEPTVDQFVTVLTLNGQSNNLVVTSSPATLTAGVNGAVTIVQRDANGNVVTSANTVLTITSTGPGAVQLFNAAGAPVSSVSLVNGVANFQIKMTAAGSYTITASTGVNVNPTSFTTTVTAAAPASVTMTPTTTAVAAGGGVTYTLSFQDAFGNPATFVGTATVAYAGAMVAASSPPSVAVNTTTGQNTFVVNTKQTGTVGVTVTIPNPSGTGVLTSNTGTITVTAGAATTVVVSPVGSGPFVIGVPITVNVMVLDSSGNVVPVSGPLTVNPGTDPLAVVSPNPPQLTNGTGTFTVTYGSAGSYPIIVTAPGGAVGSSVGVVVGNVPPRPSPTSTLSNVYAAATGKGKGGSPVVSIFGASSPDPVASFTPFPAGSGGEVDDGSIGFTGGIRSAVADVTGDGVADYIFGSGPTITAQVKIFDGKTGKELTSLRPFGDFTGGVFVAAGDIDGDGAADIVVTPDEGGGPRVTIYKGKNFSQIANFFGIDDPNFRGGARAALGDVNGDGFADLVISAGFGGGPRVSIYDGAALRNGAKLNVVGDFFIFEQELRNGAYVAVGDVNGDGLADVIGGGGPGGGPRVLIIDAATLLSKGFQAALSVPLVNNFLGDVNNRGGIRVAAKNLDGDKFADVVVGAGEGAGTNVTAYRGLDFSLLQSFDLLPGFEGGVFVG